MNLAFVDIAYGYTADRPGNDAPLGGTTSAICFLARELTAQGIDCTFYNKILAPAEAHGIPSLPLSDLSDPGCYQRHSAFIFCGRWLEGMVNLVRTQTSAPLVAWMHESQFSPPLVPALNAFDAVVFVSDWQKKVNQIHAKPHWREAVIRNAMNPGATQLFPPGTAILPHKVKPPSLIYAGSFARGAFHIAPILDRLRLRHPDFTMKIFCETSPSKHAPSDEAYISWLSQQKNIVHVGMVGQVKLLEHMKTATSILIPNPWPETSCITLIEAMAAGLEVITTNRAALPETASGFATLVPIENADDPSRFDMAIDHERFAEEVARIITHQSNFPLQTEDHLRTQINYFHDNYQWSQRVTSWIKLFQDLGRQHPS